MSRARRPPVPLLPVIFIAGLSASVLAALAGLALVGAAASAQASCGAAGTAGASAIPVGGPGQGQVVGATEYGGPGDPSSGHVGARGDDLLTHPDSYAELGGLTWATASAMGGLPYGTALRITWAGHSVIAFKRDFGLGGGPIAGHARVIDLWWQLAARLGIPYENGRWSGLVRVERLAGPAAAATPAVGPDGSGAGCASAPGQPPLAPGERAQLLPDGLAAAPAAAPPAVRGMIAAGNDIAGRPYVYGGGHGVPLSVLSPDYDCSSSVEHLLFGGGLIAAGYTVASSTLMSFGAPGPGRWVTIYASPVHVFMYVAGLRWDTHNAAGPGDGSGGIGWHPLVRASGGFVARHPVGL